MENFYYSIKNTTFFTAPSAAFLAVCCFERNSS